MCIVGLYVCAHVCIISMWYAIVSLYARVCIDCTEDAYVCACMCAREVLLLGID